MILAGLVVSLLEISLFVGHQALVTHEAANLLLGDVLAAQLLTVYLRLSLSTPPRRSLQRFFAIVLTTTDVFISYLLPFCSEISSVILPVGKE